MARAKEVRTNGTKRFKKTLPNVGKTQIHQTKMKDHIGKLMSVDKGSGGFARVVPLEDRPCKIGVVDKPLAVPPTLKTDQSHVRSFVMKVLSKHS